MINNYKMLINEVKKQFFENNNISNEKVFDIGRKLTKELVYERKGLKDMARLMVEFLELGAKTNILLLGTKGSGKTHLIKYLLSEVKTNYDVNVNYINCRDYNTSFQIMQALSGVSAKKMSSMALDNFIMNNDITKKTFLVIDEVDLMKDDNLFYHITRNEKLSNIYLVMITNKARFYQDVLSEDVKSSMDYNLFFFDSYKVEEVYDILQKRAKQGLFRYDESMVKNTAAINTKFYNSDTRLGIRTIRKIFNDKNFNNLTHEEIKHIIQNTYIEQKGKIINQLPYIKLLLIKLISIHKKSNKIYDELGKMGQNFAKTHFFRLVEDLQNLDLVAGRKLRENRSYVYEYDLLMDKENLKLVKELLDEGVV